MAVTELSRAQLNQEFRDGERPSGDDFASAWLSFMHKSDDGVKIDGKGNLELKAGIAIKNAADDSQAGTLRFNSGTAQLQYHNGTNFQNISTGAGGAFQEVDGGPNVAFGDGNVGIGSFAAAPTHRLEVNLEKNAGPEQRVKLGNVVIHSGTTDATAGAYINTFNRAGDTDYALFQNQAGNTTLNASGELSLNQNAASRFKIFTSGNITLTPAASVTLTGNLTVTGDINYTGNLTDISDVRLKQDVHPFKEGFDKLLALDPVTFKFNGKAGTLDDDKKRIGLIAQDVQKIFPELIHSQSRKLNPEDPEETEVLAIDSRPLTFVIINALKELATRLDKLEKKLSDGKRKSKDSA